MSDGWRGLALTGVSLDNFVQFIVVWRSDGRATLSFLSVRSDDGN
jgi:hypothetical protein